MNRTYCNTFLNGGRVIPRLLRRANVNITIDMLFIQNDSLLGIIVLLSAHKKNLSADIDKKRLRTT